MVRIFVGARAPSTCVTAHAAQVELQAAACSALHGEVGCSFTTGLWFLVVEFRVVCKMTKITETK